MRSRSGVCQSGLLVEPLTFMAASVFPVCRPHRRGFAAARAGEARRARQPGV